LAGRKRCCFDATENNDYRTIERHCNEESRGYVGDRSSG
jgi:hypothetical protein